RFRTDARRFVEHGDREVRYADVPCHAAAFRLGKRAQGFRKRYFGLWPMDQQKIDVIETESLEARFRRAKKVCLARVQLGDLGGDEQVFARDAARTDTFAHALFGTVFACGIDVTITAGDGRCDELDRAV